MKKIYANDLFRRLQDTVLNKYWMIALGIVPMMTQAQQTYSFTAAGATGGAGPTQLQLNSAYASTNLNGLVTSAGGIQSFTVPHAGSYRIEAYGASGGNSSNPPGNLGGMGAKVVGEFTFTAGSVIRILVGQAGISGNISGFPDVQQSGGTGGGGSYVVAAGNVPLLVAGGGGGGSQSGSGGGLNAIGAAAVTSSNGVNGGGAGSSGGNGGVGGLGGVSFNWTGWHGGTGGGGFTGDGVGNSAGTSGYGTVNGPGIAFINGGAGGSAGSSGRSGGFGGGGAAGFTGGGGGGYSGGGAGTTNGSPNVGGGGGGSWNAGSNQVNTAGVNSGDGKVLITELCNISLSTLGLNSSGALCAGNSVTITTNAISNYAWSNGATTSSIVVSPSSTTLYSLTATSPSNCTASAAITITVNNTPPTLTVSNTANSGGICPNSTVNLTATGAITYTWAGGSPTVTNGVTFSPIAAYDYTVTGANGCGTVSAVSSVSVHPFPTINTSVSSSTICSGNSVTVTATGNATNYVWSGAATTITNGVGFVPATSGTFVVTGTSALSCTAMASVPVTVYITPTLAPSASPSLVCLGGSSTLTAVGALNYTWTSATQTVNTNTLLVTPNLGVSSYTVTKANSNCAHTSVISITTNSLPTIAAFASPATACALSSVTLAAGGAQTYTWTAPGTPNYTFTGSSNVISAPVATTYTVAASDGTCINIATVLLNIDPNPTITISASSSSICNGQQVTLTANGGNSYTWTAGSTTLTGPSITQSPTSPISYVVTGDNNFGCTSQASQIVLVYNSPSIAVSANKNLICSGNPVVFTASGANTYTWDASAGGSVAGSVTVTPTRSTSGFVTYSVQSTNSVGCISTGTGQVNIYVPVLSVSGATNACKGSTVSLTANGGNSGSYNWDAGSGGLINSQVLTTSVTAPTAYTLSASSTSLSLTCPVSLTVNAGLYPDANIVATAQRTTICNSESVELYASGGVSYTWNNTATGGTIVVSPNMQTTYTVTGIDQNGCKGTGTVQVRMSGCVGITEHGSNGNGFIIYPNPNNGEFTVQSSSDVKLVLVNELGQLIQSIELSEGNNRTASVKDLAKGIYFLQGPQNSNIHQKIIVAK